MEIMKKRLLILGAGRGQTALIKTAQEIGLHVIVGTIPGNYPGIDMADEVCYMDISDSEDVLRKARTLTLNGIATCCLDTGVASLGKVADELGLCGLTAESARLCADKYEMKRVLMDHEVSTAKFCLVHNDKEIRGALKKLSLPVIIKATDLQGSRGIYIAQTEEEALEGLRRSLAETHRDYCIVEEYIEGWEFGTQAFVYNGEVLFVLPHGDNTFMSHTAVPVGHYVPLECDESLKKQAVEATTKAIHALGLDNCAVNVDLIAKDGVVYIIELTGRVGANCLPELVGINYNINYYEMIARMAIGEDPREVFAKKADVETAGLAKMIISPERSGIIKNIAYKGKEDPDVCEVTFFKHEGDEVCKFTNSKDCIGQLIVKGKDMNACEKKEQEVLSQIVLDLE